MIPTARQPVVTLVFDKQKLADLVSLLRGMPKSMPLVLSRALNRAAMALRSRVAHDAAAALKLPVSVVKARIGAVWAKPERLESRVRIYERGFSFWWLKPKQTKAGVTLGATGETIPHAFIAVLRKNSYISPAEARRFWTTKREQRLYAGWIYGGAGRQQHPGVYLRKGKSRFPVLAQRTSGVVAAIQKAGRWEANIAEALGVLNDRLRAETERIVKGGKWSAVQSYINEDWASWRSRMGAEEFR